jgi:hypothetical protein
LPVPIKILNFVELSLPYLEIFSLLFGGFDDFKKKEDSKIFDLGSLVFMTPIRENFVKHEYTSIVPIEYERSENYWKIYNNS